MGTMDKCSARSAPASPHTVAGEQPFEGGGVVAGRGHGGGDFLILQRRPAGHPGHGSLEHLVVVLHLLGRDLGLFGRETDGGNLQL